MALNRRLCLYSNDGDVTGRQRFKNGTKRDVLFRASAVFVESSLAAIFAFAENPIQQVIQINIQPSACREVLAIPVTESS